MQSKDASTETSSIYDSHLVAAMGIQWAHAVTTRLVLEANSGCHNTLRDSPYTVNSFRVIGPKKLL